MSQQRRGVASVTLLHAGVLLVVASAVRSLDGGGFLPGVNETARVRAAAQDPQILLLWLPIAFLAGLAAAAVSRRRRPGRLSSSAVRWALTAVAFPAMFGVSEASAHAGAPMKWEELGWPVILQVLLAAALVVAGWTIRERLRAAESAQAYTAQIHLRFSRCIPSSSIDRRPLAVRERGPPLARHFDDLSLNLGAIL